jgi:hypothetical protein
MQRAGRTDESTESIVREIEQIDADLVLAMPIPGDWRCRRLHAFSRTRADWTIRAGRVSAAPHQPNVS